MWLREPLPFIQEFIGQLDEGLQLHQPHRRLSRIQRGWLQQFQIQRYMRISDLLIEIGCNKI